MKNIITLFVLCVFFTMGSESALALPKVKYTKDAPKGFVKTHKYLMKRIEFKYNSKGIEPFENHECRAYAIDMLTGYMHPFSTGTQGKQEIYPDTLAAIEFLRIGASQGDYLCADMLSDILSDMASGFHNPEQATWASRKVLDGLYLAEAKEASFFEKHTTRAFGYNPVSLIECFLSGTGTDSCYGFTKKATEKTRKKFRDELYKGMTSDPELLKKITLEYLNGSKRVEKDLFLAALCYGVLVKSHNDVIAAREIVDIYTGNFPAFGKRAKAESLDAINRKVNWLWKTEDWKKVVEALDVSLYLDKGNSQQHYNRALAYYNWGKYKQVMADCSTVMSKTGRSQKLYSDAYNLHKEAGELQAQRDRERAETVAAIFGVVMGVAADVATAAIVSKQKSAPQTSSYASTYSGSRSYQNTFNNLMAVSIAQVQQQEMQEYQMVRQNYLKIGKDISLDEYRMMKGAALMESQGSGASLSSSERYGSNDRGSVGSNTTSVSSHKCAYCNGTGRETKYSSAPTFGLSDPTRKCEECGQPISRSNFHSHVTCGHCGGTGKMK